MKPTETTTILPCPAIINAIPPQGNPLKAPISCWKNLHAVTPSGQTTIIDFILGIRLGRYSKLIQPIREAIQGGNLELAAELKDKLPAVSLSGLVTKGGRAQAHQEGRLLHSGFLQGDFDLKDFAPRAAEEIKKTLSGDEHVQAAFLSPRGGVKAIIRIRVCETKAEHTASFIAAESYFRENYGLALDNSTKDPVRMFLASDDPEAYFKWSPATPLPVAQSAVGESTPRGNAANFKLNDDSGNKETGKHERLTPETIEAMLACIPPRPDYDTWLRIASAVWGATGDEATGTALLKAWSPEGETSEYAEKFRTRLKEIGAGTLVHFARENGYERPPRGTDDDEVHIPDDIFPLPTHQIDFTMAGDIIFRTIAPAHRIFSREGSVCEVVDELGQPAYFKPVSPERFCSLLEAFERRVARREWQEGRGGKEGGRYVWRSDRLPMKTARILLCSDSASRHLPKVRQLVACPVITSGGKVLGPGYHDHAGGTYVTGGDIPPEMPVKAAVLAILGLFDDFKFVAPADKSRAVSSVLSPALKMGDWITEDFPLDVAEADESQSGKTYRQKIVNRIYNSIPSAVAAPRGGVGSLDESLSAALIRGGPFIMMDNFRGKLDSTIAEQALRGVGRVDCRALRTSAAVDTRPFIWQISTNGAEFTRDIANRSIITRIRKQGGDHRFKEFPEGDLLAHVAARQPFYLGAVFSVINEWARQGCQKTNDQRHDFRGWCQAMDWIVQNIFKLPPLLDGHREEQARTANPALQWLRDVTMAVRRGNYLGQELITSQLVSIAEDAGIEFPGNPVSREEPHQRAGKILGRLFRETDGQPITVDGLTVTREDRSRFVEGRGNEPQKFYTVRQSPER